MDLARLRQQANDAFEAGRLEEALVHFAALEAQDGDPEWSRRAAQIFNRLGQPADEVEALNRAARGYQRQGDILKAAVTSKLILAIDPNHAETKRRIPELVAGRDRELKAEPRPPPSPEDKKKIADAISNFYLRDLLPQPKDFEAKPSTGVHPIALKGDDEEPDFSIDLVEEIPADDVMELDAAGNIVKTEGTPPAEDKQELRVAADTLRQTLFGELSQSTFAALVMAARIVTLKRDEELFHQGDPGDALYVVASGTLGVVDEGPPRRGVAKLEAHAVFGEIALLTRQPRTATILALTDAELVAIDRQVVRVLTAEDRDLLELLLRFVRDRLVDRLLGTNPLFTVLSERDRGKLRRKFKLLEVDAGGLLIEQGKMPDGLVILLAGRAEVVRTTDAGERILGQLGPSDVAGEISLLTQEPAIGTVRTTERSLAVLLPAPSFLTIVNARPHARSFIEKLIAQRVEQAKKILAGDLPHAEGRIFN